eukprot:TRINITY_DN56654_c0_g1_i1.p1 TRINITY_DN56654_c0_g1~~TRINITY_DN56654_c0_g1_i1.p1  ORF type:complete len:316 (-),score=52.28 TRINITY_DN56654_c0_g1_i1:89-994(-)
MWLSAADVVASLVPRVRTKSSKCRRYSSACAPAATVYVVRHGQSEWNLAAKQLDPWTMFSQVDHPLTARGIEQAKQLRTRAEAARVAGDADADALLAPAARLYSSPLTRAASTAALLALEESHAKVASRRIVLLPEARELAWPFGGPDTMINTVGPQIASRCCEKLSLGSSAQAALLAAVDASRMTGAAACPMGIAGLWESRRQMLDRLARILQILGGDLACEKEEQPSILVAHCILIRRLFESYASAGFEADRSAWLMQLRTRKLENCGVLRLRLTGSGSCSGHRIVIDDAELVLGSRLL